MYGASVESALLPWEWAAGRLRAARLYWIVTVRPGGRPHSRPIWGVWLDDNAFYFSTGSLAARNLQSNPQMTVHLEDGNEVVIVEGSGEQVADRDTLEAFCRAYNEKYNWDMHPTDDGRVDDSQGNGSALFRTRPHVVFGWRTEVDSPTRWTFEA